MKTAMKFVCLVLAVSVFSTAAIAKAAFAENGYVRLAIKGTNVNLRPQPRAAGQVVAQMNAGDVFFAEKWPINCDSDGSQWYKIVLPATDSGKIKQLRDWDSRFRANVAFVNANYATVSPLKRGDMERILETPAGRGHSSGAGYDRSGKFDMWRFQTACVRNVGANLPEIVRKWGEAEIERNAYEFLGTYVIFTSVEQPDFSVTFYEMPPELDGTSDFPAIRYLQTISATRKGASIGGIRIGNDDKNSIKKLLGEPDSRDEDGEGVYWNWNTELSDLNVYFDGNGRVSAMYLQARSAD